MARSASGLFWEYQSDKRDCALYPLRDKCLSKSDRRGARKVSARCFAANRQRSPERRYSPEYREALKLQQIWCEGTFAAQKRGHNLTQVLRRGPLSLICRGHESEQDDKIRWVMPHVIFFICPNEG